MSRLASKSLKTHNDDKSAHAMMTETVQILANKVYQEFERLITNYGTEIVETLMPLIVSILENLEDISKSKQSNELEIVILQEDNVELKKQYERERNLRKQIDEKILTMEFGFDEERKSFHDKVDTLESLVRLQDVKSKNHSETVSRYEDKVEELKTENMKLYDRYTDIFKSHAELLSRVKAHQNLNGFSSLDSNICFQSMIKQPASLVHVDENENQYHFENFPIDNMQLVNTDELNMNIVSNVNNSTNNEDNGEVVANILLNDRFSTCSSDKQRQTSTSYCDELTDGENSVDFNGNHECSENGDEYGNISREIEYLISENQELTDTKNALNIVKDDLIAKLDSLTSENDMLREDIHIHLNKHADLTSRISFLEGELKRVKLELQKYQSNATFNSSDISENQDPIDSKDNCRTFTRIEVAVLLQERNHYKERLLELQDALVYKENMRLRKQHPDYDDKQNNASRTRNQSSVWNFFKNLLKSEDSDKSISIEEKVKSLKSRRISYSTKSKVIETNNKINFFRFKLEFDRSQLYSWSVPRSFVEDGSLPKKLPIPLKIQKIFDTTDKVICMTTGYDEDPENGHNSSIWCILYTSNKYYFLIQLGLANKSPELTLKYSIKIKFPTPPIAICEVPAIIYAIKGINNLNNNQYALKSVLYKTKAPNSAKLTKVFHTKVLIKPKSHVGTKTMWIACEKNQLAVFILYDNNKLEGRMATVTLPGELGTIKYCLGRVFVTLLNGSICIFELNKDLNQWDLHQCLLVQCDIDTQSASQSFVKESILLSTVLCVDIDQCKLWISSAISNECYIIDLINNCPQHKLVVGSENDKSKTIESMVKNDTYQIIILSTKGTGELIGYDCGTFEQRLRLNLNSGIFDLIEPILSKVDVEISFLNLTMDQDRLWMNSDNGMVIIVTNNCLDKYIQSYQQSSTNYSSILLNQEIYISCHAFAQSIMSLFNLSYMSDNSILESEDLDCTRRISIDNQEICLPPDPPRFSGSMMTVIGSSYINMNNTIDDLVSLSNYAVIWKI